MNETHLPIYKGFPFSNPREKWSYLTFLANNFGKYYVQINEKQTGVVSKWFSIYEVWNWEQNEKFWKFIEKVNQRSVLPSEVVIKINEVGENKAFLIAINVIKVLKVTYFGVFLSKDGYHLHFIIPSLSKFNSYTYKQLVDNFLYNLLKDIETYWEINFYPDFIELEFNKWIDSSDFIKRFLIGNWDELLPHKLIGESLYSLPRRWIHVGESKLQI